jgi:hypothetical protein
MLLSTGGADAMAASERKRKSGIPTGNAGEYFVMGELLRRGVDAQLADRNTKGYDILIGRPGGRAMWKVQVKTVRSPPWYVSLADFEGDLLDQITVYVLLGPEESTKAVRYFMVANRDVADSIHRPPGWVGHGFMRMKAIEQYESKWDKLLDLA